MALTAENLNIVNDNPANRVSVNLALDYLNRSTTAVSFMQEIANRQTPINIVHGEALTQYNPNTGIIDWNPSLGIHIIANPSGGFQFQADSISVGARSAAVALAHEAAHVINPIPETVDWDYDYLNSYEKSIIEKENQVAVELGEPQRFNYAGKAFYATDPTVHSTVLVDGSLSEGVAWVRVDGMGNPIVQGAYQIGAYPKDAPAVAPSAETAFDDSGTHPWLSETSTFDIRGVLEIQIDVLDAGGQQVKKYDLNNTHPYDELDISQDATGKPTAVQMKIDGQNVTAAAASVGQVLGSALGRALAPNNQFGQIAIGTVAGAIGQQLAQTFAASLLTDASKISLAGAFTDFHISIAGAGAGAVASFLTAELGHALGLSGFNEQMFNATVGTLASGVANRIAADMAAQLTFDGAIGAINWGGAVLGAVNNIEPNIASIFGAYLGRELVPAQTHEGAVGGQLLGAVGSAIGIVLGNVLGGVLNFIIPGIGSLIGTIVGTLIGDKLGAHPHPAAVDTIDPAGDHYGYTHSSVAEGGTYDAPDKMAAAAVNIINGYLNAVNGAAIDHGKQTMVGYVTDPDFRYINGWTPSHEYFSFVSPDDAVHRAALDILQHTEVIGGNLLLKRAHHNSPSSIPDPDPEWAGLTTPSSESRAEKLVSMSGDLSVAQDYENYLNNREAINALMAANVNMAGSRDSCRQIAFA